MLARYRPYESGTHPPISFCGRSSRYRNPQEEGKKTGGVRREHHGCTDETTMNDYVHMKQPIIAWLGVCWVRAKRSLALPSLLSRQQVAHTTGHQSIPPTLTSSRGSQLSQLDQPSPLIFAALLFLFKLIYHP